MAYKAERDTDLSSECDDSVKDATYEQSDRDENSIIFSSCSSDISELSNDIILQKSLTVINSDIQLDDKFNNLAKKNSKEAPKKLESNLKVIKGYKKKKTYCKLCSADVTNFERHLERHHKDCKRVREMLTFPKKSKERKQIIGLLRKEGHFEEYLRGNIRPIYKTETRPNGQYFPCVSCKGLYLRQFLARHSKKCSAAAINKDSNRIKHLSASQTLVASALSSNNTLHSMRVKHEVFDKMKADEISLIAKSDSLICHFGEQYLKKHNRKQMAVVCSNKMRELARLLIQYKIIKKYDNCKLIDIINPVMFDDVVECAKIIGGYNQDKKTYRAPSLSAHLGTSLKQVSDLLIRLILKQDPIIRINENLEMKLKEVKRFKELVSSQWTTEISSLAFKNINETKWNKPTILPLTKDVIKFKIYVTQIANKAVAALRENFNNKTEFRNLVETTLILTVLYNRRRIGDVQYTKLQTYLTNFSSNNQEECLKCLSESEKELTKHYKRIVTGGKGSRAIVILFPQYLQDNVNLIIDIRLSTSLVPSNNPYLFAYPNSEQWVRGDVAIRKYAQKANLEQPQNISSNKLRKQIATVMQILNLNHEEISQFASFMGHTEKTHNEFYKMQEDVYQTAKVSKLLILMDRGTGDKYKGKSLNEIDINPEVDLAESEESDEEEIYETNTTKFLNITSSESTELEPNADSDKYEVEKTETEKPDEKKLPSIARFTLLIFLLVAIIILLSVVIILLVSFNASNNNKIMSNNETVDSNKTNDETNEFESTVASPQIPGSTYKLIYRDIWGGRPALYERPQKLPVKYVLISHTAGAECLTITSCSKQMEQIQKLHIASGSPDTGYNFLIGGDANIYVARGWDNHNFHMNLDTIGISFIGNYMHNVLTPEMIEATQHLLKMGVEEEKLDKDYILVAHNQTYNTASPGTNVYKQIKFWPHFTSDILTDIDK